MVYDKRGVDTAVSRKSSVIQGAPFATGKSGSTSPPAVAGEAAALTVNTGALAGVLVSLI